MMPQLAFEIRLTQMITASMIKHFDVEDGNEACARAIIRITARAGFTDPQDNDGALALRVRGTKPEPKHKSKPKPRCKQNP